MGLFGVLLMVPLEILPMVPLVANGTIGTTIGTNGITNGTIDRTINTRRDIHFSPGKARVTIYAQNCTAGTLFKSKLCQKPHVNTKL